jgi:hypothetical protein
MLITKDVIDLIKRYRTAPGAGGGAGTVLGIPIYQSAPAAVDDICQPYFIDGDWDKIRLMFPDGTDKGICIPTGFI